MLSHARAALTGDRDRREDTKPEIKQADRARMPLSRSLDGGLFELRFSLGSTARRITYRFASDGRIVLLTTFRRQRDNERVEVTRARSVAERCARSDPRRET